MLGIACLTLLSVGDVRSALAVLPVQTHSDNVRSLDGGVRQRFTELMRCNVRTKLFLAAGAVVIAFNIGNLANAGLSDGLVGYYPFNGNANDASGNGNHGVPDQIYLAANRFGESAKALNIRPTVESRVEVEGSQSFVFEDQFSLSCWIKVAQPWSYHQESFAWQYDASSNSGWHFGINQDDSRYGAGKYAVNFQVNVTGATNLITLDYVADYSEINQWNHVVGVFGRGSIKIYVNGALRETAPAPGVLKNAAAPLVIGGSHHPVSGAYHRLIDDIRIYNRALAESDVIALYKIEAFSPGSERPHLSIRTSRLWITMHLEPGKTYQLQKSTDNFDWHHFGEPFTAETAILETEVVIESTREFFRVVETPQEESTFLVVEGSFTWHEAKADAEARGGRLAVLNTKEKIDTVNDYLLAYYGDELWRVHIGLTDELIEGEYRWLSGEVLGASKWAGQEFLPTPLEDYVSWYRTNDPANGWFDHPASSREHYLIEISGLGQPNIP